MNYFPERLKHARKMSGMSLQDLSDAIPDEALSKQTLGRLETGETKPDTRIISALSKALKLTSDYFFKTMGSVSLVDVKFRKLKKLPVKEQDRVTALTVDFLERYIELEEMLGIQTEVRFRPKSCKVKDISDLEIAAETLRRQWNLGLDPLPNIIEMLEENHIKVFTLSVDPSFSGMSTFVKERMPVIVLNTNSCIPITRRRFTAIHELAHLYLDLDHLAEKECEKYCDRFAGAFLLPQKKLLEFLGEKRSRIITRELFMIGGLYGVSLAAVMYRAKDLDIVSASYMKFFMIQYNKLQMKDREHDVYRNEERSDRFLQLLIRAVAEEVISTSKGAALYNQKLGEFREILDAQ